MKATYDEVMTQLARMKAIVKEMRELKFPEEDIRRIENRITALYQDYKDDGII